MALPIVKLRNTDSIAEKLRSEFSARFEGEPRFFRAPGRVNLIGEHTDYNSGFVMPAAIGLGIWVAAAASDSGWIEVHSVQEGQTAKFPVDTAQTQPGRDWTDYVRGVQAQLQRAGITVPGAMLLIDGDLPIGAGLGSSAALEVATALALLDVAKAKADHVVVAQLCQRAENEFVGAQCGIMDQFASVNGRRGQAILLDCRSLEWRWLPLPSNIRLVICNTMVKHSIAAGEYNTRRAECEECLRLLSQFRSGISVLRDIGADDLRHHAHVLSDSLFRRAQHIVTENMRVLQAAEAFQSGDMKELGLLMHESHLSLRDDYEVSCFELDLMVELARHVPGTIGARMTGGGFGGCAIALVEESAVEGFVAAVSSAYRNATGINPEIYVTEADDGAGPLS